MHIFKCKNNLILHIKSFSVWQNSHTCDIFILIFADHHFFAKHYYSTYTTNIYNKLFHNSSDAKMHVLNFLTGKGNIWNHKHGTFCYRIEFVVHNKYFNRAFIQKIRIIFSLVWKNLVLNCISIRKVYKIFVFAFIRYAAASEISGTKFTTE